MKQATACFAAVQHMLQSKPGGCCTAAPFQAAVLFAEDQVFVIQSTVLGAMLQDVQSVRMHGHTYCLSVCCSRRVIAFSPIKSC